ncbi:thioredoxin family protein [Polluticaenibacter yanchengensis]|uniref:Thioredoxin family protein n=1 Tax=Polluticaenibacter yanchengensis TaxID=3014562 RepID=A0ABT4UJV8_9BACT|nr:thioredoxin family protein [Chitinophagaceae bacterium LY-5]
MNFDEYNQLHQQIVNSTPTDPPYNNPDYFNYAKLNASRTSRWLKTGIITPENQEIIKNIKTPQTWILITEPWCGDASHIVPFIHLLATINPNINLSIELRDAEPYRINQYLTNGGKAIPILIIRDENHNDLAVWGPRPKDAQDLFLKLKSEQADFETQKVQLQNWYNNNKGIDIQNEITALLK